MLSKNLILLAVIGLAIYFLTKPVNSNPIKNSGTLEENASISKSETNPDSEELQQAITNSSEDKETSGIVTEVEQELEGKAESEASGTHSFKPTETDGENLFFNDLYFLSISSISFLSISNSSSLIIEMLSE